MVDLTISARSGIRIISKRFQNVAAGKGLMISKVLALFNDTDINITTEGRGLFGAAVGETTFVTAYMDQMVAKITHRVKAFAKIAKACPQAAYTGFT